MVTLQSWCVPEILTVCRIKEIYFFKNTMRKLRFIAFQQCILRGGLPLVELSQNEDFLQKTASKTGFLSITIPDQLTLSSHNSCSKPPNLKNYHIFGILRTSAFRWAIGKAAGVNIVRSAATWIFFANGHPKTQTNVFFCISHNYSTFWCRRPYMGSTMRKLTSWRFQKCVTYRGSEFLNGSYCCSKSTESAIFDSSPKISGVTKKRHGHNNENWVPKRSSTQDNPIC